MVTIVTVARVLQRQKTAASSNQTAFSARAMVKKGTTISLGLSRFEKGRGVTILHVAEEKKD